MSRAVNSMPVARSHDHMPLRGSETGDAPYQSVTGALPFLDGAPAWGVLGTMTSLLALTIRNFGLGAL
jgi:hypothetical protein